MGEVDFLMGVYDGTSRLLDDTNGGITTLNPKRNFLIRDGVYHDAKNELGVISSRPPSDVFF